MENNIFIITPFDLHDQLILIVLISLFLQYTLWNYTLRSLLHYPVISSRFGPYIFLKTIFKLL